MKSSFISSLLFVVVSLLSIPAISAPSCQKTGSVCVEGPSTKYISGVAQTRACWDYQDTYSCVDPNAIDYCVAMSSTPGCNIVSSSCSETAFNGTCLSFKNIYQCGTAVPQNAGVVELSANYTVIYDSIDTSPCNSYSSNPSCQLSSKVCVEGPSTKNINGLDVYKECWQWKEDYNCVVSNPVDYCSPLKAAACLKQSDTCSNTAFTGVCIEKEVKYICAEKIPDPLPTNVVQLSTTYSITSDTKDNSQCQSLDNNPNCTIASQVCTQGPATRNINGLDVYKDCWAWQKNYTCASKALTSTCGHLKDNPLCTISGTKCVDNLPDGSCGLMEYQYKCADSEGTNTVETDCGLQTFCVSGQCFDTGYLPSSDFGAAIANMELARQATNYDIFKGESGHCKNKLVKNCCKAKGGGGGGRNDVIANTVGSTLLKVGLEEIRVWGSKFVYEGLMSTNNLMIQHYANAAVDSGILSGTGSFSVWGATFEVTRSGITFTGFDPYSLMISIAIHVIMDMMSCEQEEQMLGMKRGQNLCTQVGSWCSTKFLGVCLEKTEGWCCFPSKLGRIVNEQGRAQIGKGWGSPQGPDCSGFTLDELKNLRFDQMDLREFMNDVIASPKTTNYAVDRLQQKARSYYAE